MEALQLAAALLIAVTAIVVGRRVARWARTLRACSKLPHPEMGILGCMDMMKDQDHVSHTFTRFANQLGGIFYVRVLHIPMVVVADPMLWQAALAPGIDLPKGRMYGVIDQMTSPNGRHPNLLGHHKHDGYWKLVRKGVATAFSPKNIRGVFPHVLELTEQLSAVLHRAGPQQYLDLDNLLQRESLDVIARIGFGTNFNAIQSFHLPGEVASQQGAGGGKASSSSSGSASSGEVVKGAAGVDNGIFSVMASAGAEVVARLSNPLRFMLRYATPGCRKGEANLREMQARMRALLSDIQARGPPQDDDTSIAGHLLRLRDPATGQPLPNERLAAEIGLFFFAGFETTGHTMGWTLFCVAQHPEVEAKICAELDGLGLLVTPSRPNPRRLEYSDLSKLKYLGMVVKESMRLVPVSGGTVRVSPDRPIQLGQHTVPAGVEIILAVHPLHNSELYWDRPSEFLPERWEEYQAEYWLGDASKSKAAANKQQNGAAAAADGFELMEDEDAVRVDAARPPKRFLPFVAGLRACIGQNLAKMNLHATLAVLLSRFSFDLAPELRGPGAMWDIHANRLTMQPKDGLAMKCLPRGGGAADA